VATFRRDVIDFPFLGARAKVNGIDMYQETGFAYQETGFAYQETGFAYQETGFAKDPEDEQRCGTYGLFPLGQARFLLTARKSGFESGYDSKVGI